MSGKRIAVLISGLPRFSRITSDLIESVSKQFINDQVDWFFYLWNYSIPQMHVHDSWLNLDIEKTRNRLLARLPKNHRLADLDIGQHEPATISFVPMFLSIYRTNLMRQKLEANENFLYDLVMRVRPDMNFVGDINFDIRENTLIVPHIDYQNTHPTTVNDWFALGRGKDINIYTDIINHVQNYQGMLQWPEMVLCNYLTKSAIIPYVDNNLKFIFRPYPNPLDSGKPDYYGWTD